MTIIMTDLSVIFLHCVYKVISCFTSLLYSNYGFGEYIWLYFTSGHIGNLTIINSSQNTRNY